MNKRNEQEELDEEPDISKDILAEEEFKAHAVRRASRYPVLEPNSPQTHERIVYFNNLEKSKSFFSNAISTGKYTPLSFLPLFLFEQLRKAFNIFFVIISSLQQIPDVSPTGRYTTLLPLAFILTVAAIKEIVEDYIHTGDIVKVMNGHFFPADLVLLSSGHPQAMCYIETANLDGETNLKIRQGLPATSELHEEEDLEKFTGSIECEGPNCRLYNFIGTIKIQEGSNERSLPLCPDQMLLRGAMLRNTQWVYGVVVYTGHESKLMKNANRAPLKMSNVDRTTNMQIWFLMIVLVIISLASVAGSYIWKIDPGRRWYLDIGGISIWDIFLEFLTFLILYNNLVPISLLVTLEIVKFIQAYFIDCDIDMYYDVTNTPAMARTSNLNEELGQVKYIFSDKTGTLTQNRMEFKKCSVAGVKYGDEEETDSSQFNDHGFLRMLETNDEGSEEARTFSLMLAVCHTVVPEHTRNQPSHQSTFDAIEYQSSSPDEAAMVKAARSLGYIFTERTPTHVTINVHGENKIYEILNVLEFSSTRKRMSVIVRTPDGDVMLMCKGADNVIYERLADDSRHGDETEKHLTQFAKEGLRTLCFAYTFLEEKFYQHWNSNNYHKASIAIREREYLLGEAYQMVEKELHLVGASAIEDRLQDGVPETIATLAKADIKIWVLTGDKQETAINISYSCNIINSEMLLVIIDEHVLMVVEKRLDEALFEIGEEPLAQEHEFGLIITGTALAQALQPELEKRFLDLALSCKAVVCCRVSPLQKAEIVELVKKRCHAITLAIGDGANDVSMIQAAHVGVGISGFEGLQAANSSDYSIGQFKFLQKLLLVHGAWSYNRLTKCILFSFYKNICLYLMELWFLFFNGFSGQILFDRWTLTFYNLAFTVLPPFTLGLFERTCADVTMMKYPQLYSLSQGAVKYNAKVFWRMFLNSTIHSLMLFLFSAFAFSQEVTFENGKTGGYLLLGNFVYSYVVVTVCLKAGIESGTWTAFTHIAVWGSILCWFILFFIYSNTFPMFSSFGVDMAGQADVVLTCPAFWAGQLLFPVTVLFRDLMWKVFRREFRKSVVEEVRELEDEHVDPSSTIAAAQRRNPIRRRKFLDKPLMNYENTGSFYSLHDAMTGFAFSQDEGGAVSQCDIIRQYDTTENLLAHETSLTS